MIIALLSTLFATTKLMCKWHIRSDSSKPRNVKIKIGKELTPKAAPGLKTLWISVRDSSVANQ